MHWIGIGFLIAVGFGIAWLAMILFLALLPVAWEFRWPLAALVAVVVLIGLGFAYPDEAVAILAWGFIGLIAYGFYSQRKERKLAKTRKAEESKAAK